MVCASALSFFFFFDGKIRAKQEPSIIIYYYPSTYPESRPVSSWLITIRLRAIPFNITIVQAYAPTSDYDDNEIEVFSDQLQNVIDQTPKMDILVVQGDWNAKVGRDACGNGQGICGLFCNDDTNKRGFSLLEFATFNALVLANNFGHHKASRRWTWHSRNGQHHNQIDYILVRKRFRSGVSSARTQSFPGADIGSDRDLLMMTFHLRLKRFSKSKHTGFKFDFEKLKCSYVLETFQAMIGGRSLHKQRRSSLKKRQASEQEGAPQSRSSTYESSVRNISRTSKTSTMSFWKIS